MEESKTEELTQEAAEVAIMANALSKPNPAVEELKEKTPIQQVEESLVDFSKNTFKIVENDYIFAQQIQNEVLTRLPKFTENQLIALFSNSQVNLNDRISKVMAPTFGLITSKQQAEIAAKNSISLTAGDANGGNIGIRQLNASVVQDVLVGLQSFSNMLSSLQQKPSMPTQPAEKSTD
jgi:hypothetical protein